MNNIKFTKELKCNWWLIGVFVFCIWVTFPFLFKALMSWMNLVGVEFSTFAGFGPIGDIYGSLNTLFTSATLAIVVYSTILQRQANEDVRKAMDKQLQHARDATALQLREARRSSAEQIAQARESTKQQLALAQATHEAQIKEAKHAIMVSTFNTLMSQKIEKYNNIQVVVGGNKLNLNDIFNSISGQFYELKNNKWGDLKDVSKENLEEEYDNYMGELTGIRPYCEVELYFNIYKNLYDLVSNSDLEDYDKKYYYDVISASMTMSEHVTLFWLGTFSNFIHDLLYENSIRMCFKPDGLTEFSYKFYKYDPFFNA